LLLWSLEVFADDLEDIEKLLKADFVFLKYPIKTWNVVNQTRAQLIELKVDIFDRSFERFEASSEVPLDIEE
jgi:hypothetical protein